MPFSPGRIIAVIMLALALIGCRGGGGFSRGLSNTARAIDHGSKSVAHSAGKREDQFNAGWKKMESQGKPTSTSSTHGNGVDLSGLLSFATTNSDSSTSNQSATSYSMPGLYEIRTTLTGTRLDLVAVSERLASLPARSSEERMWTHLGLHWPPPVQIDRAASIAQPVQYIRLTVDSDADLIYGRDLKRGTVIVPPWREGLGWPKALPPIATPATTPPAGGASTTEAGKETP